MSFKFSILASGSTGNAIYLETEKQRLLVDAGLSGKKIESSLKQIGVSPGELDGILVSHEHSDHIKGVGILSRRYQLPIYANEKTWNAMEKSIGSIPSDLRFHAERGKSWSFEDLAVESFGVSHDAADPMFFTFYHAGKQLMILTDTGYVSDHMAGMAKEADTLIFESNHDMDMLRMGKYPWSVKRRILGDEGHVSNADAGTALADIVKDRRMNVYLAHLSLDNNMKDLARMTVEQTLNQHDIDTQAAVRLQDTDPHQPTPLRIV
ncbi:MBL fold metallo-hydrolase [Salisediminibacterium halotolerans]|uniref:Phosphoribosyl 1,2-cyclic phosphodiesterase n=1 Tax=Salisediminibacterium halotolerans TaxID=517425 RepID=A0A1H9WM90_9BACI|nr:MBL fold metallo-hydrolase [Salisediminibacterium haloalkalitolerans]SES34563.1 Phosphoribosyl 1,2-cyclic phosphodiesterase [Salisediminibacterium haloalkalitolerans]